MPILPMKPDAPQPVRPALLEPHLSKIAEMTAAAQFLCLDLHDGALTPIAAESVGLCLADIRKALDAMCEAMRLKVVTLDCVAAITGIVPREGMTESALYQRIKRRGFNADDMRKSLQALIERGHLMRVPLAADITRRGPKPHRIIWRNKEASP